MQRIIHTIKAYQMIQPGMRVLAAVSGGADSVCLLVTLAGYRSQIDFSLSVVHVEHGLRGEESLEDAQYVRKLCEALKVPFYLESVDAKRVAKERHLSVEEAARSLRYEAFYKVARKLQADRIAVAHNENDQAETVLLQLLRGTGPQGLTGIPPVRGNIVRPLLDTPRRDIERYIAEHELAYVTDETNGDTAYARNRLRLEIWPELEGINPRAAEHIACTADILRRENAYLDALAAERLRSTGTGVDCEALLAAPEALRPRMLRLLLDRLPTGRKDLGAVHLAALEQLAAGEGALSLPEGVEAVCRGGVLTLRMAETAPEETVLRRGENPYGAGYLVVSRSPMEGALALRCGAEQRLTARCWRREDRLTLPDGRGARSLKRLMAERGVRPENRRKIPVLCVDGVAAAAWGIGVDRSFLPEPSGEGIYYIIMRES